MTFTDIDAHLADIFDAPQEARRAEAETAEWARQDGCARDRKRRYQEAHRHEPAWRATRAANARRYYLAHLEACRRRARERATARRRAAGVPTAEDLARAGLKASWGRLGGLASGKARAR